MGQTTPNMSIYVPSAGETNYDQSFLSGMLNIDQHDHTGGPNNGVPIGTSGLDDDSVTYPKLNSNVADTTTGIGTQSGANANRLEILGLLANIYQIATASGFISKDGSLAYARTITGTANQVVVTDGDGVSGNPVISIPNGDPGFPGETISSFIDTGSAITPTSLVPQNITSISLTEGTWCVSAMVVYSTAVTGTQYIGSISTTSATTGSGGLNTAFTNLSPDSFSDVSISIPNVILTLGSTTTVYLVTNQVFTVGTLEVYGNIQAIRLV